MIASIVLFVRLLVAFFRDAIRVYLQTPEGQKAGNALVQAWDMLDGKDDIPDWFSQDFPFGNTPTPKDPAGAGSNQASGNPTPADKATRTYNRTR